MLIERVMQELRDLIEVSRFYGQQKDYIIGGGGNTSYKNAQNIWIKVSGGSLANIDENGFVKLDRKFLNEVSTKTYSSDVFIREEEVRNDLLRSCVEPEKGQRPSIESFIHNYIGLTYVVHTHPTKINGLMCSIQADTKTSEIFGDEVLYIEYENPGYAFFIAVEKQIIRYRNEKGKEPSVIFLQNHGVFVAADSTAEIKNIYDGLIAKLDAIYGPEPEIKPCPTNCCADVIPAVRMILSEEDLKVVRLVNNTLFELFIDEDNFKTISKPFTPDRAAYANSIFIHCRYKNDDEAFIQELQLKIAAYKEANKRYPKIIFAEGLGVLLIGDDAQYVDILEDIAIDSCRVARFAGYFNGGRPMQEKWSKFIEEREGKKTYTKISGGRVDQKIAIVTGGAQGFGAGIVEHLMKEGANVVIADLNEEKGIELADELNAVADKNRAFFVKADVSKADSVEELIEKTVTRFGGLDIFISNAGILRAGSLDEMTPETFRLMTMVNYEAYFLCAKYASKVMKLQYTYAPSHFMDIIQINSKSGLKGSNKNFAYAGGKFGGIGLTQSFALELMPFNIKVNSICPGNFYDGPLWADPEKGLFVQYLNTGKVPGAKTIDDVRKFYEAQAPAGRGCTPLDVMRAIFYVIEQQYETGQAIPVTGGQNMLN